MILFVICEKEKIVDELREIVIGFFAMSTRSVLTFYFLLTLSLAPVTCTSLSASPLLPSTLSSAPKCSHSPATIV